MHDRITNKNIKPFTQEMLEYNDLWGFGVVLYEIYNEKPVNDRTDIKNIVKKEDTLFDTCIVNILKNIFTNTKYTIGQLLVEFIKDF